MTDIWSGDPKITLSGDGSDFTYVGGQPVMDQGVENDALISLLTSDEDPTSGKPWPGNIFFSDEQKVGSDFQRTAQDTLTLKKLRLIEQSGVRALGDPAFGAVTCVATNPVSTYVEAQFQIGEGSLNVSGNQATWQAQATNPAYMRVKQ